MGEGTLLQMVAHDVKAEAVHLQDTHVQISSWLRCQVRGRKTPCSQCSLCTCWPKMRLLEMTQHLPGRHTQQAPPFQVGACL